MSMSDAARELSLYVENDGALHRQQEVPIRTNLMRWRARGKYDHAKAIKAYGYLMESGAKKYAKEHGDGTPWHQMFTTDDRRQAATEFADAFEVEARLGNYDHLLPKKYQGTDTAKPPKARASSRTTGASTGRQLNQEIDAALAEGRRVQIVKGDGTYFRAGQYGYVVGSTDKGGMATLDEGPSRSGDVSFLVSKKKKGEGGAALWFSRRGIRFGRR